VPHDPPAPRLSPDRRRTQRQAEILAARHHPLTLALGHPIRLHPDAPPVDDRDAPGPRCGTCWYRRTAAYHRRVYPKCWYPGAAGADEVERRGYPRVSHGAGTDVRAWWPACADYSPGDSGLSDDAARCVPEAVTSDA
jgi:hypothetical protein